MVIESDWIRDFGFVALANDDSLWIDRELCPVYRTDRRWSAFNARTISMSPNRRTKSLELMRRVPSADLEALARPERSGSGVGPAAYPASR